MTNRRTIIAVAVLLGMGGVAVYEHCSTAGLRREEQRLTGQLDATREAIEALARECDGFARDLASIKNDNQRLARATNELAKAEAELSALQSQVSSRTRAGSSAARQSAASQDFQAWVAMTAELKELSSRMPTRSIPELRLLREEDWLELAKRTMISHKAGLSDDDAARAAFRDVRAEAKQRLANSIQRALRRYSDANDDQIPRDILELNPYFMKRISTDNGSSTEVRDDSIEDNMLQRYEVLVGGKFAELPRNATVIAERSPVDTAYDTCLKLGLAWSGYFSLDSYSSAKRWTDEE